MAMGISKALKESVKRFGRTAGCQISPAGVKLVGKVVMGMMFQVMGSGLTWEAAFENCDLRYPAKKE